ncbi:MAG: hypothetical protein V8S87_07305 [Oscillospiraceae bacterium]
MCSTAPKNLSLDSAGAVAAHELFNIGNADAVGVTEDAVLEAGRRNGELKRGLLVVVIVQAVDQAAGKVVAAPARRSTMSRIS